VQRFGNSRRRFLAILAVASAGGLAALGPAPGQVPRGMPKPPPPPAEPRDQDQENSRSLDSESAKRARLLKTEKDFREGVERLYSLAAELRDEVHLAPSTGVFSVRMYKKTAEIEKLAKQLKGNAKG
jgi:hypothetical protein